MCSEVGFLYNRHTNIIPTKNFWQMLPMCVAIVKQENKISVFAYNYSGNTNKNTQIHISYLLSLRCQILKRAPTRISSSVIGSFKKKNIFSLSTIS